VPTLDHEAPLAVLREAPGLLPGLLPAAFGLTLPAFVDVAVADATFNQAAPVERRADLVLILRGAPPERAPSMGIVVEVQRHRDEAKRRSWPLYLAALHDRMRCPTCLVVVATDDAVARWAAAPILTFQPGWPFAPLVLGAGDVPRVSLDRAHRDPWLAVLSALVHGNRPDGTAASLAALAALADLPERQANPCYDLITGSLSQSARRALDQAMHNQSGTYEYKSEFARRYVAEGRLEEVRALLLSLAGRHGAVDDDVRERIGACTDLDLLRALALDVAGATDRDAAARVLDRMPHPAPTSP